MNYRSREYGIVVFKTNVEDKEFGLVDAIDLFYGNNMGEVEKLQRFNAVEQFIQFEEEDFYTSDLQEILNIIDNYITGMPLEISEPNALYDQELIEKCYNELLKYSKSNKSNNFINSILTLFKYSKSNKSNKFINPVLTLFKYSIDNKKNIYFFFM